MNSQQITNLVQIATGIALLAGILLVLYELNQAKSLTLAELTSQGYSEVMQDNRTLMGEMPAGVVAKACYEPDELSREELVILDSFFRSQLAHLARLRILEEVEEFGVPWQLFAREQITVIVSTEPGRWWANELFRSDAELMALTNEILQGEPNCAEFLDRFAARSG